MAGQFMSPDGDLEKIFVDDYAMVDQYAKTGSLWTWGQGSSGQLGDNAQTSRSSPVQTVAGGTNWKEFNSGGTFSAATKTDGTLWLWGVGTFGQLGDNTATNKSSPVQTISGGTNWKQFSTGRYHMGAIKTDGTLWLWGVGTSGQLGDNTVTSKSSPVQTVSGGTNWKQVACGYSDNTAAIKTDGTLWTWGNNTAGGLGDNTVTAKSSPVQTVAGGTNWKQVATGGVGGNVTTGGIKTDGTLWLWGYNSNGQLGDNTTISKSSPVQTVAAVTNWKQVSIGANFTGTIKTDGTLWTWGFNGNGQLGDGTITQKSSPIQTISGGTNWKQVTTGGSFIGAIKTDGTLWTWGYNTQGQLADNSTAHKSSPVQTVAGGTNWKQIGSNATIGAVYFYDAGDLYPDA